MSNASDITVMLGGEVLLCSVFSSKNKAIEGLFRIPKDSQYKKIQLSYKGRAYKSKFSKEKKEKKKKPHFTTKEVPAHVSVVQHQCFHVPEPDIPQ